MLDELLDTSLVEATTSTEEAYSHHPTTTRSSMGGDSFATANHEPEQPFPLLTSPWWVRIHEEYGENNHSFIPTSRRAASSAVYTLKTVGRDHEESRDVLMHGTDASRTSTYGDFIVDKEGESMDNSSALHGDAKEKTLNGDGKETQQSQNLNTATNSHQHQEYMIISGGYTDHDWKTFPVYAFPLTSSARTGSGEWIDLSPLPNEVDGEGSNES
jgi:hypothetical protein